MAQNRGRQAVQRKLYTEEIDEEDEEEERGKTVQAGNVVYILSMCTKQVTDQKISARKCKKEDPVAKPTAGGKSIIRKHPYTKGMSPVPMVIHTN